MKKIKLLSLGFALFLLASCEKIKDATTVEIDTDLKVEIPITGTASSMVTKSADGGNAVYAYTGNATFSLADNQDLKKYISNIDDIIANGVATIQITSVPAGGAINSCLLKYGLAPTAGTTALNLTTPITATNGVISITDVAWINGVISVLKQNKSASYKFEANGNASFSVNHKIVITIPVTVTAGIL
jgi:hypothetical protein